jgi:hypothetical protein
MTSVVVVVARVGTNQPYQMSMIEHDHVVEELSSRATDAAFRNGVLPGATIGNPARVGCQRLDEADDGGAEDRVAVED